MKKVILICSFMVAMHFSAFSQQSTFDELLFSRKAPSIKIDSLSFYPKYQFRNPENAFKTEQERLINNKVQINNDSQDNSQLMGIYPDHIMIPERKGYSLILKDK